MSNNVTNIVMDTNTITAVATACLVIVGIIQVITAGALVHFTRKLSDSTTKYSDQVEEQTKLMIKNIELMDTDTKLHEYENKKETITRKIDRLVKEMDALVGPLYGIINNIGYFDLRTLAVANKFEYIAPPQAGRDFIFNRKAYEAISFWEKIRQNMYLDQSVDLTDCLNYFFTYLKDYRENADKRDAYVSKFSKPKAELIAEIEKRYSSLSKEITVSETDLKALEQLYDI